MLTRWKLANFKSVTTETSLEFRPLTIFTGANSSGKSTVIQSILLASQSLQSSSRSRPVLLNGPMTRLGVFRDVVSLGDEDRQVEIGFDLAVPRTEEGGLARSSLQWRFGPYMRSASNVRAVSVGFSFSARPHSSSSESDKDLLQLQPALEASGVRVDCIDAGGDPKVDVLQIVRARESSFSRLKSVGLPVIPRSPESEAFKFSVSHVSSIGYRHRLQDLQVSCTRSGAYMNHFLPRALAVSFDESEAETVAQLAIIYGPNSYRKYGLEKQGDDPLPDEAVSLVFEALEAVLGMVPATRQDQYYRERLIEIVDDFRKVRSPKSLAQIYTRIAGKLLSEINGALTEIKPRLESILRARSSPRAGLDTEQLSDEVSFGLDFAEFYLTRGLRYLGPLRDEPKPLYPLMGAAEPGDVGLRGENTAAVLEAHRNSLVTYIPSACFGENGSRQVPVQVTLAEAVEDWLHYTGVGQSLSTVDRGKLGHELRVTVPGTSLQHDLTQVGVGVSQVLPILVLALLADASSLLILEQPELHLHPRVQSRLADFFVSLASLGKQCVLETHSDHMVNRVRLRAAADESDDVSKSVIVYFVEKSGPQSRYQAINVNELGGLDSWPEGFFDEEEKGIAELLKQGLKKRRAAEVKG